MPNHFHGIVIIEETPVVAKNKVAVIQVAAIHELPLQHRLARRRMLIPMVIGYLKMNSAKRIHLLDNSSLPIWQRNYYEHIVRSEQAYNAIRQYILFNPAGWETDEENR